MRRASQSETCAVRAVARTAPPSLPYASMKDSVLGKKYELSLVFIGDHLARKLNTQHRGKTYASNVLSFPNTKTEGEIFVNLTQAAREAKRLAVPFKSRVALLYVHALYHLKGYKHSNRMERAEQRVLTAFNL